MSRPDVSRITRNADTIRDGAGEPATLRRHIGTAAGAPRYGVQAQPLYIEYDVTAFFASVGGGVVYSREMMVPGGITQNTVVLVSLPERMGAQDEIIWRGTAYRADGESHPLHLGGRFQWRTPLKLAQATG